MGQKAGVGQKREVEENRPDSSACGAQGLAKVFANGNLYFTCDVPEANCLPQGLEPPAKPAPKAAKPGAKPSIKSAAQPAAQPAAGEPIPVAAALQSQTLPLEKVAPTGSSWLIL